MPATSEHARVRQVELILQQVEALPTLSPIAARLLQISSPADADLDEIVTLIESDPALTARILGLCRRADRPVLERITTVRRAVVMVGLEAVQSAVLSVSVYELMDGAGAGAEADDDEPREHRFDRKGFWTHCVAVACASELIADAHDGLKVVPEEAFVAGLLHDLGKLALDLALPRAYSRVIGLAERRGVAGSGVERELIGLDHHTAGKRLGEHWGLPHALQDAMWLHGQPPGSIPDLPHKALVSIVSVADAVCRGLHLGWSGDFDPAPLAHAACREHGLDGDLVESASAKLHAMVVERCKLLGIDDQTSPELLMRCLTGANRQLARINTLLQARSRIAQRQSRVLGAINAFHADRNPGRTVSDALSDVARSACVLLGSGFCAVLFQSRPDDPAEPWQLVQFAPDGTAVRSSVIDAPRGRTSSLSRLADPEQISLSALSLLPWLTDYLTDAGDIRRVRLLPLTGTREDGPAVVLLHEADIESVGLDRALLSAATGTWAAVIVAAAQHDGAKRLGEKLASSNRSLAEAQNRLAEAQSLVRLGEMAAGAAHEMNNPLTVISGRSQLLAHSLTAQSDKAAAAAIVNAAQHLTDLITSLRLLSDPPTPVLAPTPLSAVVAGAIERAERRTGQHGRVRVNVADPPPVAAVDRELASMAVSEAITNALEASREGPIDVRVHRASADDRLLIEVEDKGTGMTPKTLQHAFDPFYSDKPAGRQTGLGLARARRLVELHHGEVSLRSTPGVGTTCTFAFRAAATGVEERPGTVGAARAA
ncbi:MAG: HDOD domain-containing protein [Phycisphaerales bacterium]